MDLERIQARIRSRRPMEAVDLGFAMVSAWRGLLYPAWITACVPVMILVAVLGYRHPFAAMLAMWWLKPLLDRVPLLVIGGALFGEVRGLGDVLREIPGLWKRGLLRALLGHRFDLSRSFAMPVDQLEGLRGRARRERLRALHRRHTGDAMGLTMILFLAEAALTLSILVLLLTLLPERLVGGPLSETIEAAFMFGPPDLALAGHLLLFSQMLSILILEPYYVGGGFCLYLNRRVQLEAWDVEIAFRGMAARHRSRSGHPSAAAVAAVVAILTLCHSGSAAAGEVEPDTASAREAPHLDGSSVDQPPGPTARTEAPSTGGADGESTAPAACLQPGCLDAHHAIGLVVSDPVFGSTHEVTRWRMRPRDRTDDGPASLSGLGAAFARAIEPVMWAAALLCLLAFVALRARAVEGGAVAGLGAVHHEVLGLDLSKASLPEDIPGAARRMLDAGDAAGALSLLFRGALMDLLLRDRLSLRESMTEAECVELVARRVGAERAELFRALAAAWTSVAYGHRPPDPGRLVPLISAWASFFGGQP